MLTGLIQTGVLPIGVDIGESGAKLIQLRAGRGRSSVISALRVEGVGDITDDAARMKALAAAIARRLDAAKFSGRRCVVSVRNSLVQVRSMRMPRMPDDETDRALRLDGAERLGFKDEHAEIGWLRAGEIRQGEDTRDEIILVGAPTRSVEIAVDALAGIGLAPIAVEPAFAATARMLGRCFRREADQKHVRLVVDVGRSTCGVSVLRGDRVAFYKQLDWGGKRLDQAASEGIGLDIETVADIRRQRFSGESERDGAPALDARVNRAIFDAVRPILGELAHEVTLCMRYYMVTFRGDKPECVLVVGGEAEEPRLTEVIQEAAGIETRVARPLEGFDLSQARLMGVDRRSSMSQWTAAAGLSLREEAAAAAKATAKAKDSAPARTTRKEAA